MDGDKLAQAKARFPVGSRVRIIYECPSKGKTGRVLSVEGGVCNTVRIAIQPDNQGKVTQVWYDTSLEPLPTDPEPTADPFTALKERFPVGRRIKLTTDHKRLGACGLGGYGGLEGVVTGHADKCPWSKDPVVQFRHDGHPGHYYAPADLLILLPEVPQAPPAPDDSRKPVVDKTPPKDLTTDEARAWFPTGSRVKVVGSTEGYNGTTGTVLRHDRNHTIIKTDKDGKYLCSEERWEHWKLVLLSPPVDPLAEVAKKFPVGTRVREKTNAWGTGTVTKVVKNNLCDTAVWVKNDKDGQENWAKPENWEILPAPAANLTQQETTVPKPTPPPALTLEEARRRFPVGCTVRVVQKSRTHAGKTGRVMEVKNWCDNRPVAVARVDNGDGEYTYYADALERTDIPKEELNVATKKPLAEVLAEAMREEARAALLTITPEAQARVMELFKTQAREVAKEVLTEEVKELDLSTPASEAVDNALEGVDFQDKANDAIEGAIEDADIKDKVSDAIDNYDFSQVAEEAVWEAAKEHDWEDTATDAVTSVLENTGLVGDHIGAYLDRPHGKEMVATAVKAVVLGNTEVGLAISGLIGKLAEQAMRESLARAMGGELVDLEQLIRTTDQHAEELQALQVARLAQEEENQRLRNAIKEFRHDLSVTEAKIKLKPRNWWERFKFWVCG